MAAGIVEVEGLELLLLAPRDHRRSQVRLVALQANRRARGTAALPGTGAQDHDLDRLAVLVNVVLHLQAAVLWP